MNIIQWILSSTCVVVSITWTGCQSNDIEEEKKFLSEISLIQDDLTEFSQIHSSLMHKLLHKHTQEEIGETRTNNSEQLDILLHELNRNAENLLQKYDLYGDLPDEKKRPCLGEDSIALMKYDYKILFGYLKRYKSEEFCNIYKTILTDPLFVITEEEVISNSKLYLNEKYTLLLVIPVLNDYSQFSQRWTRATSDPCLEAYHQGRSGCAIEYAISCGVSCLGGVGGLALGVIWASIQLDECLDNARGEYIKCQG